MYFKTEVEGMDGWFSTTKENISEDITFELHEIDNEPCVIVTVFICQQGLRMAVNFDELCYAIDELKDEIKKNPCFNQKKERRKRGVKNAVE